MEFQSGKMKKLWRQRVGEDCTSMGKYLMPQKCTLNMIKMEKFMFCGFYHSKRETGVEALMRTRIFTSSLITGIGTEGTAALPPAFQLYKAILKSPQTLKGLSSNLCPNPGVTTCPSLPRRCCLGPLQAHRLDQDRPQAQPPGSHPASLQHSLVTVLPALPLFFPTCSAFP